MQRNKEAKDVNIVDMLLLSSGDAPVPVAAPDEGLTAPLRAAFFVARWS